jgi:hypothetical protein
MSTIQDVSEEQLAKLFHHYREALAHDCDPHGVKQETSSWDRAPQNERKLMVAAARLALMELATSSRAAQPESEVLRHAGRSGLGLLNRSSGAGDFRLDGLRNVGRRPYEFFMNS